MNKFEIQPGRGGLGKLLLTHKSGASAEVYLYGAHVTSWKDPTGRELLFLSSRADFAEGKAIRGGIPLVFPQFGGGPLPAHGFARTRLWQLEQTSTETDGTATAVFSLRENEETLKIWPHQFELRLQVRLSDKLETGLTVTNTGEETFSFANAFHTYFTVQDIERVKVSGVKGLTFLDSLKNREAGKEARDAVTFNEQVDRIYLSASDLIEFADGGAGRFVVTKYGMPDVVTWNPHAERCPKIADLLPDDYKKFVCVETGNVIPPKELAPGGTAMCRQTIQYLP